MTYVVTISATYGAGGSLVGPEVAERLGVPFLDRAIPGAVAKEIGCTLQDALEHDGRTPTGLARFLASAARLPTATIGSVDSTFIGATDGEGRLRYDQEFVDQTERVICEAASEGGVVLGRAAAAVLSGTGHALHARLDGPKERRLAQAVAIWEAAKREASAHGRDRGTPETLRRPPTRQEMADNDRARRAYVRRFYRVDPAAPELYDVIIDSTAVPLTTCADVIERLARERAATG